MEGPSNGNPLLLIHGITNNRKSFTKLIPFLETDFHLFIIDLRGHGKSQRILGDYKIIDMVSDVNCFISEVIKEPCYIYGHSLGGIISLKVLYDRPERILSIAIGDILFLMSKQSFSSGAVTFNKKIYKILKVKNNPELQLEQVQAIFGEFGRTYWEMGLNELDPNFQKIFISGSDSINNFYDQFSETNILDYLRNISKPTLFLLADQIVMSTVKEEHEILINEINNKLITIKRIPGTSHFLHIDKPEKVSMELKSFFQTI